jgi:DNA-binding LytR/AlgR family response regulator
MRCLVVDDDALSREVIKDLVEGTEGLELAGTCSNAMEAYNLLKHEQVDLVFLDVEMPKMSGLELIQSLDILPQIVLITSHPEYALESYEYNVTDFLVKPVAPARFLKAVEKARKMQSTGEEQSRSRSIFIKTDSRLVQLSVEHINFVEALGNYVMVYTDKGRYTVLSTMKDIERKLPAPAFKRVHRSYIVRVDKINSIEDNFIQIGDKQISIGKVYKDELLKSLNLL